MMLRREHRRGASPRIRDAWRRALAQGEITLGGELGVGLHHQRSRNAEIGARSRVDGTAPGPQCAAADGVAQLPFDLRLHDSRPFRSTLISSSTSRLDKCFSANWSLNAYPVCHRVIPIS